MNPLLLKLRTIMHEYTPVEFNTKYNENLEFLTDQDQKVKNEEIIKDLNSFHELDIILKELNEEIATKDFDDKQTTSYVYDNLCALVATIADFKESNIEDLLNSTYAQ